MPWPSSTVTATATSYQMAGRDPTGDWRHCLFKNCGASGRGQIGGDRQWDGPRPRVQGMPRREERPKKDFCIQPWAMVAVLLYLVSTFLPEDPKRLPVPLVFIEVLVTNLHITTFPSKLGLSVSPANVPTDT